MLTACGVSWVSPAAEDLAGGSAAAAAEHCSSRCPDDESFGSGVKLPTDCSLEVVHWPRNRGSCLDGDP